MINTFFSFLEITSYYLQQKIYILLSSQFNQIKLSMLVLLFLGGTLTSMNPCLISVLPLSLSNINSNKQNYNQENNIDKNDLIYGLISSILIIILTVLLFNQYYYKIIIHLPILSSFLTIIIGLNLLQILDFNVFTFDLSSMINTKVSINPRVANWLIGFTIGISSSSCSTPILVAIVIWIYNSGNLLFGIIYLIFYLIGYIIPIIMFVYIAINSKNIMIMTNIWNYIIPTSGSLVLGIGIFSFLENIFI